MGSVELHELEKKIIPLANLFWSQKVLNHSVNIIDQCKEESMRKTFLEECESKIKTLDPSSRITWNDEVHAFGGDECGYIWYIFSETIKTAVKLSVGIDVLGKSIFIKNIDLPSKKESRKLEKHMGSVALNNPDQAQPINTEKDIKGDD